MRMSFGSRITVGTAFALVLLILIAAAGLRSMARLQGDAQEFARVADLTTRLERLLSFVKDAQTGERGFIITGDERFLDPFRSAKRGVPAEITAIRAAMTDEAQRARLAAVVPMIERDLALMEANIRIRRSGGFPAAQRRVMAGAVKATTDSIRASFAVMGHAEQEIVADRKRRTQASVAGSRRLILTGMGLSVLFGLGGAYALSLAVKTAATRDRARFFDLPLDMLCIAQPNGVFREVNAAWKPTLGYTLEELRSRASIEFVHPDDREKTAEQFRDLLSSGRTVSFQNRWEHKDGSYRNILWSAVLDPEANMVYAMARDITVLLAAQSEVRRLSGLLPICAWCKKIRDDEGYWQRIEAYIGERSEAQFTHGICPSCSGKVDGSA